MKFLTICIIFVGIIVLFNLGGVTTPSGGYALQFIGDTDGTGASGLGNFENSALWVALGAAALVGVGIGVRAGLFGNAPPISYILSSFIVITMGGLILTDLLAVYNILWNTSESWIRSITALIFVPFSIAYIIAIKSIWEGSE